MKKNDTQEALKRIYDFALEDIMGDCFGKYAKEIIQERAIPDVRDGLKPVQRRILYAMHLANNNWEKPYIKCAATVGDVLGKFHPHGDSSVYEAMVRMSQWWKQSIPTITIHGNNGSIDGDPAAAYRYTEARLAKISGELLSDLDKETVSWAPNFDDRFLEPTVLPANFPNLLVNGTTGISAGYATDIPPHNLGEIIDATIKRIDSENCRLETLLDIVKGPDFPTGGIVEGKDGLINAYKTGKGKIVVKSKYEIIKEKGKPKIVITDIPYDVLKSNIIRKIDEIRIDKKIEGIVEVRDESDKNDNIRIVVDLKTDANVNLIENYLLKNTDLQINYNFNMVAIVNKRPKQLGLLEIIDAFISHRKIVVTRRTEFELNNKISRAHIVEGFIKALDILDEVIKVIRKSKNKQDAISNLVKEFEFTHLQAEAIVMMQLYKLTNTDVTILKEESEALKKAIEYLKSILSSEENLKKLIKEELRNVKKEYATIRKTEIKENITEIVIDELDLVNKDDYIVIVTKNGYVKKLSIKSYNNTPYNELVVREGDYIENIYKINNIDTIILFTNLGNYIYLPVRELKESKLKDLGEHISSIVNITDGEKIIRSIGINKFDDKIVTIFTKNGMVKRSKISDFVVTRYNKTLTAIKLKEDDEVINVNFNDGKETIIITKNGNALLFDTEEIPVIGLKASGVKGIKLTDDEVVGGNVLDNSDEYITIFTNNKTAKRIKISDIQKYTRAKKGISIIKSPKTKKYEVIYALPSNSKSIFGLLSDTIIEIKSSEINIMDKLSVGSNIIKKDYDEVFVINKIKVIKDKNIDEEKIDNSKKLNEDKEIQKEDKKEENVVYEAMTMSDFFDEFKI